MPESVKGIWQILLAELDNFKKITVRAFFLHPILAILLTDFKPKRTGDDVERRMNALFDSLNCATLSLPVVQQLLEICDGVFPSEKNSSVF